VVDVLVGKVFTSEHPSAETGSFPLSNITDGSESTRWISQPSIPMAITVDLEAIYDLSEITIVVAADTIQNYTLELSSDGATWSQIHSGTTNNTPSQTVTITSFQATPEGRYLRLNALSTHNATYGNSIWEIDASGRFVQTVPIGQITNFAASVTSDTSVDLSWAYSGSSLADFQLYRDGGLIASLPSSARSYSDSSLTLGTQYDYQLTGSFAGGGSTLAVSASATTTGGDIVFPNSRTTKVMPLGDSITSGSGSSSGTGYRQLLWQMMNDEGWQTESVGDQDDVTNGFSVVDNAHRRHCGHSGWTINQLSSSADSWLPSYTPDVVLLQGGGNDLSGGDSASQAASDMANLADKVLTMLPGVHLFLTTTTDGNPPKSNRIDYNNRIEAIVTARASAHNIYYLDFGGQLSSGDFADSVHPNDSGYQKFADTWMAALRAAN
jgi:lysophospholipase L1-like esterase